MMRMARYAPRRELAPYVRHFTVVEAPFASESQPLPALGLLMGIRYGGIAREEGSRLPDAALTGFRTRARQLHTSAGGGIIITTFLEAGAAQLFEGPMHELFSHTTSLADFIGAGRIAETAERISEAQDDRGKVAAVEALLLPRLAPEPVDPLIAHAVESLRSSGGMLRISALAARLDLHQDALEKRFRRVVGGTPKQLASMLRLHRALELQSRGASLTEAALGAGYSDQPHFIRSFRAVAGEAPTRWLLKRCAPPSLDSLSSRPTPRLAASGASAGL